MATGVAGPNVKERRMKREYAEAYVRWYHEKTVNINFLFTMVELYLPFAVPSIVFAHVSKKFVSAVLLVAVILFQSIVAIILKRKFSRLTYYQQFLLTGLATLYASFVFLLLSISYVEVTEFWPGYYVIFPAAWLLIVGVNIGWTWWRVKSGDYVGREEKEPQKLVGSVLVFSVAGVIVARITGPLLGQTAIRTIVVWAIFILSSLFTVGGPNLLKAHLVRKYQIYGASVEAYEWDSEKKKPLLLRIFLVVLVGALIVIGIPLVIDIVTHYFGV